MEMVRKIEEEMELRQKEKGELRKKRCEDMKRIVKEWKQTKLDMEKQEEIRKKNCEDSVRKQRYFLQ